MRTLTIVACLVLGSLAGCKDDAKPDDCAAVARKMAATDQDRYPPEVLESLGPDERRDLEHWLKDAPAQTLALRTKLCTDDAWSPEAIKCILAAKEVHEMASQCDPLITEQQKQHMGAEMGKLMPARRGKDSAPAGKRDPE